jgi:hypothetical protein
MSQENLELVKRMLALFHAGDAEGALACFFRRRCCGGDDPP